MSRRQQVREQYLWEETHIIAWSSLSLASVSLVISSFFFWREISLAHSVWQEWMGSWIYVWGLQEGGVVRKKQQQQVCEDGTIMTVRRLLFFLRYPQQRICQCSLSLSPYLTPSLSPLSLTMHTCAVSCPPHHSTSFSLVCLSQFSLFITLSLFVCTLPLSSNPLPFLSLEPPAACVHTKDLGGKEWQKQTSTCVTMTILWSCFVNHHRFLVEWNYTVWQASAHTQQVEPFLLNPTYITSRLHENEFSLIPLCYAYGYALRHTVILTWLKGM